MGIHVVDGLVRLAGVADHLAVEVDLRPSPHGAVAGREPVVPEVSGQPDPDDVGEEAQLDGVASRDAVGVGDQAVAEALRSFELSLRYCQADYRPMFAFHTIDSNAGYSAAALQAIEQSAADYIAWLNQLTEAA